MSAQAFLSTISQAAYLALFAIAAMRLVRRFSWASLDTFLFFGVIATLLLAGDLVRWLSIDAAEAVAIVNWVGICALPYILLRLADDFRPQPSALMVVAGIGFVGVALVGIVAPQPWSPSLSLVPITFVVVLGLYASIAFMRLAMQNAGVSRRRMQAVAVGSGLLAGLLLLAGVRVVWPASGEVITLVNQLVGLSVAFAYFIGFAPPPFLRRAWQEPALREMLGGSPDLLRLGDDQEVAEQIERQAAAATGAEGARLGLWDAAAGALRFGEHPIGIEQIRPGEFVSGRAFKQQRTIYTNRPQRDAPEHAEQYRTSGIRAIASAPVTISGQRLGVLTVYAARPPAFTDDAVQVLELVAEQAALVLRSRQLLQEAAHVRALGEVTRLKDDFLSVVAHDVRTPLTAIMLNVELMQQAGGFNGSSGKRLASLQREAIRLRDLVEDYLDLVRTEQDRELRLETHDLVRLVREAIGSLPDARARVRLAGDASVDGSFDERRVVQLVQNLVGNALKYSDATVEVEVRADGPLSVISVRDQGIGIPEADLPRLFERFHRGTNTDDRRHTGMGLGLYICRQIARAHGGDVTVTSRIGEGSTFTVRLPRIGQPVAATPSDEAGAS